MIRFAFQRTNSWIEAINHDVTPTPGGLLHHSTCWCKHQSNDAERSVASEVSH